MNGCKHWCDRPPVFPRTIFNRPALDRIDYRIGAYTRLRRHLLDQLNKSLTLEAWTHRGADDPGIALLEGAAMVGDILTFYQDLYANEAFLRTADWRESVADLVRLLGYRLAPGVGGDATFALKVRGTETVTVPKGFGFKAQLTDQDDAAEFESTAEVTACPHLSEFYLYDPPGTAPDIAEGDNRLELRSVGSKNDIDSLAAQKINPGDRLMLVPDGAVFNKDGVDYSPQDKAEIVIVSKVETILNRVILTFEGTLTANRGQTVSAYVIDRTFRHFGYNAARKVYNYDGIDVTAANTISRRRMDTTFSAGDSYSQLSALEMPLDQEIGDLALGGKLICQGIADIDVTGDATVIRRTSLRFTVVKTIEDVLVDTLRWGNTEGAAALVKLKNRLIANTRFTNQKMHIRRTRFHEAIGPRLTLGAVTQWRTGNFDDGLLQFFGTYDQARALAGRHVLLVHTGSRIVQAAKINSRLSDFRTQRENPLSSRDKTHEWMWDVRFNEAPQFNRQDFAPVDPKVAVYGNLVDADQGKTEKEALLGSGDHREAFQTFAIPKAPMTYLLAESQTPAQVPELKVYVQGLLWQRVGTFFGSRPDDRVYVVREDDDGKSWVQFGDGKTGARLPSGIGNVKALYRTGVGAGGSMKTGTKPQATGKLKELEAVLLPGQVVGGDDAEGAENARVAAPGKIQSLGRLVGLADYEAEILALPGVIKVRADWGAAGGRPRIGVVVLTKDGSQPALEKVAGILNTYNRCRGPARFPITVDPGYFHYVYLSLRVGYRADRRKKDLEIAIKNALGMTGEEGRGIKNDEGLFAMPARSFGGAVHGSQIIAAVQQVPGITWVIVDDAQALDERDPPETDPTRLDKPATASTEPSILCPATRVLALYTGHLDLNLTMDETQKECG